MPVSGILFSPNLDLSILGLKRTRKSRLELLKRLGRTKSSTSKPDADGRARERERDREGGREEVEGHGLACLNLKFFSP